MNVFDGNRVENQIDCSEFLRSQNGELIHFHVICSGLVAVVLIDCEQIFLKHSPPIDHIERHHFGNSD